MIERLVGLTEMVPEPLWNLGEKGLWFSVWLVRRSAWVLGTSLALLVLPPFIEQQRVEYEEMQNMQKKQVTAFCSNIFDCCIAIVCDEETSTMCLSFCTAVDAGSRSSRCIPSQIDQVHHIPHSETNASHVVLCQSIFMYM